MQLLDLILITWHITFGTYGARLHGDERPTVDRHHNQRGQPFLVPDSTRREAERGRMRFPPVILAHEQRIFIQAAIPDICHRGGWTLRICAAGPDHVHVLLDINPAIHGEKVRRLIKRWLGQEMDKRWRIESEPGSEPGGDPGSEPGGPPPRPPELPGETGLPGQPGSGRPGSLGSLAEGASWWAEEGSNKPVKDEQYLNNAYTYIEEQRAQ